MSLKMKKSTTVKTRTMGYVWIDTCDTFDRGWETMVFRCNENGNVLDWMDLDSELYINENNAFKGHDEMVEKWKDM